MSTTPTEILETTLETIESTVASLAATEASLATEATEAAIDIESIKELMDGFDPAALLPDLSKVFSSLEPLCRWAVMIGPVILLLLGLAYLFLAPKEANHYFGYRTYFGMGSVHAWRFTQRLAGVVLGGLGLVLTVVMFVISRSFAGMEVTDMVWRAVNCLAWQAGLVLAANVAIIGAAAFRFDRKGEYRGKKRSRK